MPPRWRVKEQCFLTSFLSSLIISVHPSLSVTKIHLNLEVELKKGCCRFSTLTISKAAATTRSRTKKAEVKGGVEMRDEAIELTYAVTQTDCSWWSRFSKTWCTEDSGPSAVLTLKQFKHTWWDPKVLLRNLTKNCKIMIFTIGILSSIIVRAVNRRMWDARERSKVL